ncbi:MAG: PhzF family phenazine biosynthesis protein [Nocardioidaceae bacterium]
MRLSYDVVDVFTDRPFAGNQLAVVHGAEGLSTEQCLLLAGEFGYSETTFPETPTEEGRRYATRIFTPAGEIPFAGHPTLGTAWVLRRRGLLAGDAVVQQCGAGDVGVRFDGELVELAAEPRDLVGPLAPGLVRRLLRLVGLVPGDLAGEAWLAGCGLTFAHLPVTEEAVVRATPPGPAAERLAAWVSEAGDLRHPGSGLNVYAVAGEAPRLSVHARVFVPGVGVGEDPATGSAAAGLGLTLAAAGRLPEGGRFEITQGVEMGRPSRLSGRVEATGGRGTRCHVGGEVQPVAAGEVAVP